MHGFPIILHHTFFNKYEKTVNVTFERGYYDIMCLYNIFNSCIFLVKQINYKVTNMIFRTKILCVFKVEYYGPKFLAKTQGI